MMTPMPMIVAALPDRLEPVMRVPVREEMTGGTEAIRCKSGRAWKSRAKLLVRPPDRPPRDVRGWLKVGRREARRVALKQSQELVLAELGSTNVPVLHPTYSFCPAFFVCVRSASPLSVRHCIRWLFFCFHSVLRDQCLFV